MKTVITTTVQLNDSDKSENLDAELAMLGDSVNCYLRMGTNHVEYSPADAVDVAWVLAGFCDI